MNFLITAIGSFSADCVISTLKVAENKVVGCDIYPSTWHYVSQKCDAVYQAPLATDEDKYIDFLISTCKKESLDYIIPLTDLEIDVLNRNREPFSAANIDLLIQSEYCLSIARNKLAMYHLFMNDSYVNVPFSINSEQLTSDFPLPAIAKPIHGRSSEGIFKVQTTNQLMEATSKKNYIVQTLINGSVYTVDYVRDAFGCDFAIPREELLRTKNGAGTTVRIIPDSLLCSTASYIGETLGILGCINMEFILSNGKYYLIDLNPRFSAGVAFSNYVGFDMVSSHVNAVLGRHIGMAIDFNEQILCKYYQETVLWSNK